MCTATLIEFVKDIVVPILALFTSIIAVYFTYKGLKIQREHNSKTLKPIGKLRSFDYQNNILIRIDNYGTGPLIIKNVFVNQENIGEKGIINFIPEEFSDRILWKNFTGSYPGRAIPPNENLELLRWTTDNYKKNELKNIDDDRAKLRSILKEITLKLEYQGIYEDELYTDELELSWYGRHDGKND